MASGVEVADACIAAYDLVKSGKQKYAIFKINDDYSEIVTCETEECKYKRKPVPEDFEQFLTHLPEDSCRYGIYLAQIGIMGVENVKGYREKIVFVVWAPDTAKIKDKMLIAASKEPLKKACVGINYSFQFSSPGEVEAKEWIEKIGDSAVIKMAGKVVEFEGRATDDW